MSTRKRSFYADVTEKIAPPNQRYLALNTNECFFRHPVYITYSNLKSSYLIVVSPRYTKDLFDKNCIQELSLTVSNLIQKY